MSSLHQSVGALKSGLERLDWKQSEAASTTGGVSMATSSAASTTEADGGDTENSTDRNTGPATGGEADTKRLSLSPPPFPPSPRRLSPSPTSTAEFRGYLDHLPEMNLPWQPLRSVTRCSCGRAFTFLVSKVSR